MLALIGVDAIPSQLMTELEAEGRLPRLQELRASAGRIELATPANLFPAAAFPTLWSGLPVEQHGIHYPFMWDAAAQRVRFMHGFPHPPVFWEPISQRGGRVVVVDPYEAFPPRGTANGLVVSGWQFGNRVVLREWSEPRGALHDWSRRLGRPQRAEEVFGEPSERRLRQLASVLLRGPARAAALATEAVRELKPDLLVICFPSVHLAGHQLWDPGRVVSGIDAVAAAKLRAALPAVVAETDRAVGAVVDGLPPGADIVVFSSLGMDVERSRSDILGTMLGAVLDGRRLHDGGAAGASRVRAAVPTSLRAGVARALPDAVATALAARLELRGTDWSATRAFTVPSDTLGMIRFNLRGRERDGIVDPSATGALADEIREGLLSFTIDGEGPAVAAVEVVAEALGTPPSSLLPDLVVRWSELPSRRDEVIVSPRFGTIRRTGVGSGRSGNHTANAWAIVAPTNGRVRTDGARSVVDLAATAGERFGIGGPGRSLIEP